MSLTGDPDGPPYRAGISVFDVMAGNHAVIGILAALRHRDATGEGQHVEVNLLSSALSGLVNHSSAYVAGGVVPYRMGNAHPSVFPYEPLPDRRPRPDHRRGQRPPVPQAVRRPRHPGGRRRPAVRPQPRPHREPGRAAADPGRAARDPQRRRVVRPAGRRRGAVRADQHDRRRVRDGRAVRAGARWSRWGRASGRCRWRGTRSRSPRRPPGYPLPPPELDEHGAELRKWLSTVRHDGDCGRPTTTTALGASSRDAITLLGHDLAARRHGRGRVRRAGLLAGHPAPPGRPARCGCSRRCSPRWPTTASPRPRSSRG